MPHVDEGTLHALLDGALRAESPDEAERVEGHLRACEDCRARYEDAAETRDAAAAILAGAPVDITPDFDDVLRRAEAREAGGPSAPAGSSMAGLVRQARWTRRIAWAASIVIALGTGYLVGDRLGGPLPGGTERSEASRPEALAPGAARSGADASRAGPAEPPAEGPAVGQAPFGADRDRVDRPAPFAQQSARVAAEEDADREPSPAGRQVEETPVGDPRGEADLAGEMDPAAEVAEAGRVAEPEPGPEAQKAVTAAPDAVARGARAVEAAERPAAADAANRLQDELAADALALERMGVTAAAPADTAWQPVDLAAARRAVSDSLYVLPRAEPQEAFLSADGDAVLTVQRLSSGVIVRVTQRRSGAAAVHAEARRAPEPAEAPDTTRSGEEAPVARATVGGFLLEVTGPIPTELLEILASAAAPLRP